MMIYLGSDHGGYDLKNILKDYLESAGNGNYEVVDLGCFSTDSVDYPDIAREVCEKVAINEGSRGILVCGTGIGMQISANKINGIRATVATDEHMAEMSRRHNDANVITLGGRTTESALAKKIIAKFLTTDFEKSEERHVRRVEKMNNLGKK